MLWTSSLVKVNGKKREKGEETDSKPRGDRALGSESVNHGTHLSIVMKEVILVLVSREFILQVMKLLGWMDMFPEVMC